jgi:hypothetical protein
MRLVLVPESPNSTWKLKLLPATQKGGVPGAALKTGATVNSPAEQVVLPARKPTHDKSLTADAVKAQAEEAESSHKIDTTSAWAAFVLPLIFEEKNMYEGCAWLLSMAFSLAGLRLWASLSSSCRKSFIGF